MRLILFEIFGIKIYSYGFMIAIGIITAGYMFMKRAKNKGYDEDSIFNLTIISVIAGVLGGKLLFILTELNTVIKNPSVLLKFGEGFVIYGAIIAGALAVYIYCRIKKWNILEVLDLIVPGIAIAQGFGRIGCFLAGCCYGKETDIFCGVTFPINSLALSGVKLIPTQLFSSAFDFILGGFLILVARKTKIKGSTVSIYIIVYSIGRFIIEFLRNDPRGSVWILSTSQFISIFTLIVGIAILYIAKVKGREKNSEEN